jgi:predicted secreted protein
MQITSIIAVYFLFFVMSAFIMLPFGIRTTEEVGAAKVPGQADSAPGNFRPGKLLIRATVIAIVLTTLFVLNFEYGWVEIDDINIWPEPPARMNERG